MLQAAFNCSLYIYAVRDTHTHTHVIWIALGNQSLCSCKASIKQFVAVFAPEENDELYLV